LADCYRSDLVAETPVLDREHAAHSANLLAARVDLVLIETVNTIREAGAAARAVRGSVPFVVSFVTDGKGALLSGEPLEQAVRSVLSFGPAAIGVNCIWPRAIDVELAHVKAAAEGVPVSAYANTLSDRVDPRDYAEQAAEWIRSGARIVGGCCGTTPGHTAELRGAIDRLP
ncbi:MAG: homocysteine S-methyltransferase family protein, partial [Thermoanaerobaculia bacterium]